MVEKEAAQQQKRKSDGGGRVLCHLAPGLYTVAVVYSESRSELANRPRPDRRGGQTATVQLQVLPGEPSQLKLASEAARFSSGLMASNSWSGAPAIRTIASDVRFRLLDACGNQLVERDEAWTVACTLEYADDDDNAEGKGSGDLALLPVLEGSELVQSESEASKGFAISTRRLLAAWDDASSAFLFERLTLLPGLGATEGVHTLRLCFSARHRGVVCDDERLHLALNFTLATDQGRTERASELKAKLAPLQTEMDNCRKVYAENCDPAEVAGRRRPGGSARRSSGCG